MVSPPMCQLTLQQALLSLAPKGAGKRVEVSESRMRRASCSPSPLVQKQVPDLWPVHVSGIRQQGSCPIACWVEGKFLLGKNRAMNGQSWS